MDTEADITPAVRAPEEPIHRTARTILVGLHAAEAELDIDRSNTELPVRQRADRIMKAAQSGNLRPALYKIAWFLARTFPQ
jgi:hypothetical protein